MLSIAKRIVDEPGLDWSGVGLVNFINVIAVVCGLMPGYELECSSFALGPDVAKKLQELGAKRIMISRAILNMHRFDGEKMKKLLGENVRMAVTHMKFAVVSAAGRSISILTSANLSKNNRWEWLHMTDDPAVAGLLIGHLDELESIGDVAFRSWSYYTSTYKRAMHGDCSTSDDCDFSELVGRINR